MMFIIISGILRLSNNREEFVIDVVDRLAVDDPQEGAEEEGAEEAEEEDEETVKQRKEVEFIIRKSNKKILVMEAKNVVSLSTPILETDGFWQLCAEMHVWAFENNDRKIPVYGVLTDACNW